jgi:hypothetical protein
MQKAKAVDLGPLSVTIGFCQQIDKVAAIVNSFTVVQWPTNGVPGVTTGLLSQTSVVMDFCTYITQMEQLDTTQAIFYTGNYLNQLTGLKWDDHLKQADATWNILNTVYDFEDGSTRQGAFESASTYQQMNDYIKDTYKWSNKTFNNRDAELKTRGQRESDMNRLASLAYQRSILKEMTNCPVPQDKDYSKVYTNIIDPQTKKKEDAEEDYLFYKEKLLSMGPKFLDNETEMQRFVDQIEALETTGMTYTIKAGDISIASTKVDPKKKDAKGKPIQNKTTLTRKYQDFSVSISDRMYSDFNSQYSDRWKSFVSNSVIAGGSFGLLDSPQERIEKDYKDLSYECNPRKLMQGYDTNSGTYDQDLAKKKTQCEEQVQMSQKQVESLLAYYVNQMKGSLYIMKSANAIIWTTESREMGRTRVVTPGQKAEAGFQQEQVKCSESLTPAEMDKLSLKQQSVNNEMNEMLYQETQKQTMLKEMEMSSKADAMKEYSIRRDQIERKSQENEKEREISPTITPPRGGINMGGK